MWKCHMHQNDIAKASQCSDLFPQSAPTSFRVCTCSYRHFVTHMDTNPSSVPRINHANPIYVHLDSWGNLGIWKSHGDDGRLPEKSCHNWKQEKESNWGEGKEGMEIKVKRPVGKEDLALRKGQGVQQGSDAEPATILTKLHSAFFNIPLPMCL